MPRGLSLHVGLNSVDANAYNGWNGALLGCENDANDMATLAASQGFSSRTILTRDATAETIVSGIADAANNLSEGDIFLLTYSGHGGQFPDTNGDESDGLDETWLAWNREIIDDELYALWSNFAPGVRIVVLSDSCHSGTVTRIREFNLIRGVHSVAMGGESTLRFPTRREIRYELEHGERNRDFVTVGGPKTIDPAVQRRHYTQHAPNYRDIERRAGDGDKAVIRATVILISGCQDSQLSGDGPRNGVFTGCLLEIWARGQFRGYRGFHGEIRSAMPSWQVPAYSIVGAANPAFEAQRPFTL